jgi:hypothetical protein
MEEKEVVKNDEIVFDKGDEEWRKMADVKTSVDVSDLEISNYGRVRTMENKEILNQKILNGYKTVLFFVSISRAVLITFKGFDKDEKRKIVNHIDGNKMNNHISNLEWTTQKENVQHALKHKLVGLHDKKIIKCDADGKELGTYNSIIEASKSINLTRHAISKVLKGQNTTAGGFKWKYADKKNEVRDVDLTEFVKIKDYDTYMVSKKGEVYSSTQRKRLLIPCKNASGALYVTLVKDKKKKNCYIHQLVAQSFLPNPKNRKHIKHKDGNKENNVIENLEWF